MINTPVVVEKFIFWNLLILLMLAVHLYNEMTLKSCDRLQLSKPQNRTISHGVTVATDPVQGRQLVCVCDGKQVFESLPI